MFSTLPNTYFNFLVTSILSSAKSFNLDQSKNLMFGKGLALTVLEPTQLAYVDRADQDQTAQNVQSDLQSTLSANSLQAMAETTLT